MKRFNLANKVLAAGVVLGGSLLAPAQALGLNSGTPKSAAQVALATSIVDSTRDPLQDANSDPKDLPRLNPSNLSISTGRDGQGNLLVTDSGATQYVEQAPRNSGPKGLIAAATPAATKPVDGIGFNPKIKFSLFAIDNTSINTFYGSSAAPTLNQQYSQLYNQYILVPGVSMSFFGKDQLMVTGVLSNYQANTPGCGAPLWSTSHFYCFQTQNSFQLFRAWYSFPINDNIRVMAGPRMYTYDLLPVSTAMYSPKGQI
jgi:hypothetical protein